MKQFNLEIILKRSKHCYKKPQPKLVKFSARVLASCATKQPALGILGTNGINAELLWPKKNPPKVVNLLKTKPAMENVRNKQTINI